MRGIPIFAGLALASAAPLAANSPASEQVEVIDGVNAFFDALRSDDKTALANTLLPEGVIFIHNRMEADNWKVDLRTAADHLKNWLNSPAGLDETMSYETVLVDGDMAQVWGPYSFHADGKVIHCGINSMSMVRTGDGSWKVGNVSFTMVPPSQCAEVGADWVAIDDK